MTRSQSNNTPGSGQSKAAQLSIVCFEKSGGPLTKRISLTATGEVKSDGSACTMPEGIARRVRFQDIAEFGEFIGRLSSNQAIALGSLRSDLPDQVKVITKRRMNGQTRPDIIARTNSNIAYSRGTPALALLDFDAKGMPPEVADKLNQVGGFWPALLSMMPALEGTAKVTRLSTSAGLIRADTGERLSGSGGQHGYVVAMSGGDIGRFLRALHDRCWLCGYGWMVVGTAGQFLERSIVDHSVGAPERLVFEGAPVLEPPLQQDAESRRPVIANGELLDTIAACPPITIIEVARIRELKARAKHRLKPEADAARFAFTTRSGYSTRSAQRQLEGILRADVVLPFDDPELRNATVGDVLERPTEFEGETLADPIEGVAYGTCTAMVMIRPDGTPWIHSFAHGRTVYELKYDAATVRAKMEQASNEDIVNTFIKFALMADLEVDEVETLRNFAAERAGINKRTIDVMLKAARKAQAQKHAMEEKERRRAQRSDPRPQVRVPLEDAPWLPEMDAINEVLGKSPEPEPPMRDIEGIVTQVRKRRVPGMHAFTQQSANQEDEE